MGYFKFLRQERTREGKGYTAPSTFLETVRFAKFTVDLKGAAAILESRRLLGFAAVEKREKGPVRQAPPLELEHLQRLHSVLASDANNVDRLGAGCMLICIFARARWSDVRYIDHVEVESKRNGCLVLYTTEHKLSGVGLRREQFLPLVVPWDGVTNDNWLKTFLELYALMCLDIHKVPLGPLLPAPRVNGGFCARPLTTKEASRWLKELLRGTKDFMSFRSHSLKATLLTWCARAGVDKEVRSVLGHHCSAASGSEVVYARNLQVCPVRKLQMLLRLIRIGMGFEEIIERGNIAGVTPGLATPAVPLAVHGMNVMTPVFPVVHTSLGEDAVDTAIGQVHELDDQDSAKQELDEEAEALASAGDLSLFPEQFVQQGLIEIESSLGSESDSSSSSIDALEEGLVGPEPLYEEHVPEGWVYYKHIKSQRVHSVRVNGAHTSCKMKFQALERVIQFKYPKCLRCFPEGLGRIRTREEAVEALDQAIARARRVRQS